jgi:hypothetical protein
MALFRPHVAGTIWTEDLFTDPRTGNKASQWLNMSLVTETSILN